MKLEAILKSIPRIKDMLKREGVEYLGPCVVQAPGSWTRVGPTWIVPGIGWVCIGPGAKTWGTKAGLAELATFDTATPEWHAVGVAVVPDPNLVFAVTKEALGSGHMSEVKELASEVK